VSFLERLRAGLRRTTDELVGRFDRFGAEPATATDSLDTLEEILLEADVGVAASRRLLDVVREYTGDADLRSVVKLELLRLLDAPIPAPVGGVCPRVVLVVGVNGTGKTTTVGRLARLLTLSGQQPMICAADTFRAAAVEQLEVWARRAEVEFIRARPGGDAAAVVFDAIVAGKARGCDVVLVDTAGRLHTRANLMAELDKIRRVAGRAVDGAPHETLLVLDATVGQNGMAQARAFLEAVGVTGVVLTKLDGTAKGGIAVAITAELGVPIRYVGIGEQLDDLVPFSAADYVEALFEPAW
jgi:fused signal recognition particle receptor